MHNIQNSSSGNGGRLDVVIPCLNEEDVVVETLTKVCSMAIGLDQWSCRIIIVDDGSTDSTVSRVTDFLPPSGISIRLLALTRNFGHQAALSAGLEATDADAVAIIDADLQDPPELIPAMLELLLQGHDVVYGKRGVRQGASWMKKLSYKTFYRLLRKISTGVEIPLDSGDFRVISRRVRDELVSMPEKRRFIRGMVPYLGFPEAAIEYQRPARHAGETKYSWRKLFGLALDGIVSTSVIPLRLAFSIGTGLFLISFISIIVVLAIRLATESWVPGWATTTILLLGFGGLQFLFLGILGEYIARIFYEVKGRPGWLIKRDITLT